MASFDFASFVPVVVSFVTDVLTDRKNHKGLFFLVASLATSFAVLRPRRNYQAELERRLDAKPTPLLPHQVLLAEDITYIEKARRLIRQTPHPIHSNFLVAACISYLDADGEERFVVGVNSETCVLPSAICAERCALLQVGHTLLGGAVSDK